MRYRDSAEYPIIAIDFDDTICMTRDTYPECGKARMHAKEVINFMHKLGIKIVIWTSRDVAFNQDEKKLYDHVTPMINWLDAEGIHYDAVNKSVQFAPYPYNGRKVYAHMYVDDRNYMGGTHFADNGNDPMFLMILEEFLKYVCRFSRTSAEIVRVCCEQELEPEDWMIEGVKNWKTRKHYVDGPPSYNVELGAFTSCSIE